MNVPTVSTLVDNLDVRPELRKTGLPFFPSQSTKWIFPGGWGYVIPPSHAPIHPSGNEIRFKLFRPLLPTAVTFAQNVFARP
jgi:hypothetical protein